MKKAYHQLLSATKSPVIQLPGKKMLGSELEIVNRPLAVAAAIRLVKYKIPSLLKENDVQGTGFCFNS